MAASVGSVDQTNQSIPSSSNLSNHFEPAINLGLAFGLRQYALIREMNIPISAARVYSNSRLLTDFIHGVSFSMATRTLLDVLETNYRKLSTREINALSAGALIASAAGLYTGATWTRIAFLVANALQDHAFFEENDFSNFGTPEFSLRIEWHGAFIKAGIAYGFSRYFGGFVNTTAFVAREIHLLACTLFTTFGIIQFARDGS